MGVLKSVVAFESAARAAMADAEAAGFHAVEWSCEDLLEAVLDRGGDEQDIREVVTACCSIVRERRQAGWASDLAMPRQTLDQALHRVLCGRSVYSR